MQWKGVLTLQFQVCDNVGDHLIGNVYARYEWETEAQAAVDNLNDRWYAGAYAVYGAPISVLMTFISSRSTAICRVVARDRLP